MKMIQKIGLRILLLGVIISLSNLIYKTTTYDQDLKSEGNVLRKFERGCAEADILYFSASPNAAIGINDTDKRTIAQMMDDGLPQQKLMAVDTGGIHAGVFKKLIALIPDNSRVKTVVVNMNYRSFGYGWIQSKLENAIQKQMVFYSKRPAIVNRFLQGLNYYDALPDRDREQLMHKHWNEDSLPYPPPHHTVSAWCEQEKWGDWTNPKRQLADNYIKNFAFVLNESNPRVQDFDEIVTLCAEKNIKLVFVILPENLEEARTLVGDDLTRLMIENKNWLLKRYNKNGVRVVDCFDQVADQYFTEREFPSEHFTQEGRQTVASAAVSALLH